VTVITGEEIAFLDDGLTLSLQQPFTLVPAAGAFQTGAPGSTLARPLIVLSQDANGVPISGVSVSFSVAMGDGSVSPALATTDSQGLAQTQLTLGPTPGPNIVVASASQFASTSFVESSGAQFTFAYARSGDQQTGTAAAELPTPLTVTVVASGGGPPLAGIAVTWVVATGGGTVRPLAAVTDSAGRVSAVWRLGPSAGIQTVRAIPYFYNGVSLFGFNGTTFTATAQGGSVVPSVPATGILNSAGFDSSVAGVSAGAIVSIFGANLSNPPANGVQPGLVPGTNMLHVTSNGTQVTFDGVPAPLFFVSPAQLNVQVPFEVAGKASTQIIVQLAGVPSPPVTVTVLSATPGLFTVNSSGRGPAVVLNQDGSLNSASNGEAPDRVIQLFATGLGPVSPAVATGRLAPTSPPLAVSTELPVVTIGGVPAVVEFSGLSPGFVGLWQVNVRVPPGSSPGELPLALRMGGRNANQVSVFIR